MKIDGSLGYKVFQKTVSPNLETSFIKRLPKAVALCYGFLLGCDFFVFF